MHNWSLKTKQYHSCIVRCQFGPVCLCSVPFFFFFLFLSQCFNASCIWRTQKPRTVLLTLDFETTVPPSYWEECSAFKKKCLSVCKFNEYFCSLSSSQVTRETRSTSKVSFLTCHLLEPLIICVELPACLAFEFVVEFAWIVFASTFWWSSAMQEWIP